MSGIGTELQDPSTKASEQSPVATPQRKYPGKDATDFLMKWATLCSRDTLHYLTLFSKVKLLIGVKKSTLIFSLP
jgi:hypothetical protein